MYWPAIYRIVAFWTVGSVIARSVKDAPVASMSTQGEMHQPPPQVGRPASRIASIAPITRPPPALSPAMMIRFGLMPVSRR